MNKICVVQFDNRINEFNTKVSELSRKYCEINNYDYFFQNDLDFDFSKHEDLMEFANNQNTKIRFIECYYRFQLLF